MLMCIVDGPEGGRSSMTAVSHELLADETTVAALAEHYGVSVRTLQRAAAAAGVRPIGRGPAARLTSPDVLLIREALRRCLTRSPGVPGHLVRTRHQKRETLTSPGRGQLPDGKWTEFVTDSPHRPAAQAFVRRFLESGTVTALPPRAPRVDLETAAHHYKEARARSNVERDRVDRIVGLVGGTTPVADVNQTHLTTAARKFRERRAQENAAARAEDRQTFPLPSTPTINRELTTPLRAVLNFAGEQHWRSKIVLRAVKAEEGEIPSMPRPAARDADVDKILRAIEERLATLFRPTGKGRDLNYHRQVTSLKALRALILVVHERGYRISEWLRWDWRTVDLPAAIGKILLSKAHALGRLRHVAQGRGRPRRHAGQGRGQGLPSAPPHECLQRRGQGGAQGCDLAAARKPAGRCHRDHAQYWRSDRGAKVRLACQHQDDAALSSGRRR